MLNKSDVTPCGNFFSTQYYPSPLAIKLLLLTSHGSSRLNLKLQFAFFAFRPLVFSVRRVAIMLSQMIALLPIFPALFRTEFNVQVVLHRMRAVIKSRALWRCTDDAVQSDLWSM